MQSLVEATIRHHIRAISALNSPASIRSTPRTRRFYARIPRPNGFSSSASLKALALCGVGATAYGIYRFLVPRVTWPLELEQDLRSGIKAQLEGDLALSERYLRRAWNSCKPISIHANLGPDPWLKVSGVASKLGEVLESSRQSAEAYEVYSECLRMMQATDEQLSSAERLRAVALALHLGELADALGKLKEEEEWLLYSVAESNRLVESREIGRGRYSIHYTPPESHECLASAWEALGSYHARVGNTQAAIWIYNTIIHKMLHGTKEWSSEGRCRLGQIITSLTSLLIYKSPTPENLEHAKKLSKFGLHMVDTVQHHLVSPELDCEHVLTTLMFNLGALLEMQNEHDAAKEQFENALRHAKEIGMREGVEEAEEALSRLSNANHSNSIDDQNGG